VCACVRPGAPSRRTSYGAVVALDERLSCDELVEDRCG
jgi:hypothetical protein